MVMVRLHAADISLALANFGLFEQDLVLTNIALVRFSKCTTRQFNSAYTPFAALATELVLSVNFLVPLQNPHVTMSPLIVQYIFSDIEYRVFRTILVVLEDT